MYIHHKSRWSIVFPTLVFKDKIFTQKAPDVTCSVDEHVCTVRGYSIGFISFCIIKPMNKAYGFPP